MRRVVLLLLIVLAGCGQAERPYTPVAEPTPAKPSVKATQPAQSLPSGPQSIAIGDGLRVRVEWPADPDPLLKVIVDQYVGTRQAVVEGTRGYRRNLEIQAEAQATEWVNQFVDEERSLRGTGRLYDLRVSARMGKGAQINACVDESGVRLISSRTGKAVASQPDWLRAPYSQSVVAHRGDDGVWRIRSYITSTERCTR
ncbi:hypothetical protein [Nonomuraea angiospora]|uniref:hypothetical protein n=1 Tax=Nonomuraea angiospora TaxID=46172 RepID=UPI0029B65460|nr:hypothetical protein [Nonomuraea angiospora]MDX3101522.1 hypothetical protein [Nonomuraea angiospora]